ncbi:hypothetical protein [Halobacillus campisalis]|uniref:Uncharacterized protein n=1 Tax=Halobacillus campisalis TaxID=435909 RepID=A0ABW2K007_9BACI|nr:hypothetical protein [Halobacillus campisalis]
MEVLSIILSSSLVSGIITTLIIQINNHRINKRNNYHNKKLQVDNFFRNISNEELLKLLNDWHDIVYRREGEELKIDDKTLLRRTFFYGSAETIRRLSLYQSHMYNSKPEDQGDIEGSARGGVLITGVIVSLKKDFSDENIPIEYLMKTYLPWYDEEFDKEVKRQIKFFNYD